MKKIGEIIRAIIVVGMILMMGCAIDQGQVQIQIQIDPGSQQMIARIAARHVGYEINKGYSDVAKEVLTLSKDILVAEKEEAISVAIGRITTILTSEAIDDPLLIMDIQDLVNSLEVKMDIGITKEQMAIIKAVAEGLISGIEMENLFDK